MTVLISYMSSLFCEIVVENKYEYINYLDIIKKGCLKGCLRNTVNMVCSDDCNNGHV